MTEQPIGFEALPPMERAAWKVEKFGDFAPLELEELAAILGCSVGTVESFGAVPSEIGPRTKRYLWGTVKKAMKDAEQAA